MENNPASITKAAAAAAAEIQAEVDAAGLGAKKPDPATHGRRQVPSVGRVVHYVAYGTPGGEFPAGVCRAAVVTEVDDPGNPESPVGLCVLNPNGQFFNRHIAYSAEPQPGTWHWPEYVPPVD